MLNRMSVMVFGIWFVLTGLGAFAHSDASKTAPGVGRSVEFAPPEIILDGSEYGCGMHPHYGDFDNDGKIDQVVGIWDRLLIFRNLGTNAIPTYAKPTWFDETEPSARIPAG